MSITITRVVTCDNCRTSSFVGPAAAAYAAGWRRVGSDPKHDRCPACRERIGLRPIRRSKRVEVPVLPQRARMRYGAAAYMTSERRAAAMTGTEASE